jgi:hypothetical protein
LIRVRGSEGVLRRRILWLALAVSLLAAEIVLVARAWCPAANGVLAAYGIAVVAITIALKGERLTSFRDRFVAAFCGLGFIVLVQELFLIFRSGSASVASHHGLLTTVMMIGSCAVLSVPVARLASPSE